jgi:hypothetical protein
MNVRFTTYALHQAMAHGQRLLDGLPFARHLADHLQWEEHHPIQGLSG